jgi:hypothetical protein
MSDHAFEDKTIEAQKCAVDIRAPSPVGEAVDIQDIKRPSKSTLRPKALGKSKDELLFREPPKKRTTRPFFLKADETKSVKELRRDLGKLAVPYDDCFDHKSLLERLAQVKELEKKRGSESRFIEHNWQSNWNNPKNWTSETHRLLHTHGLFFKYTDEIVASTYQIPPPQKSNHLEPLPKKDSCVTSDFFF